MSVFQYDLRVSPPIVASASLGMALLETIVTVTCVSVTFFRPVYGPSKVYCHSHDCRLRSQGLILSVKCIRMLIYNAVLPLQYALLNHLYFPF